MQADSTVSPHRHELGTISYVLPSTAPVVVANDQLLQCPQGPQAQLELIRLATLERIGRCIPQELLATAATLPTQLEVHLGSVGYIGRSIDRAATV